MMCFRLLIYNGIFVFLSQLNAQEITISYDLVLDKLLENYHPAIGQDEFLSISRQEGGYYVGIQGQKTPFPARQYPYWMNGEEYPRDLPFRRRTKADLIAHYGTEIAGKWRKRQFDRHLYFGYPGFTKHSIATLSTKKKRSPQETRMLARAHAEHAMNLLNNQYGTSDPEMRFKLDEHPYQYLDKQQLEEYLYHQLKAVRYYGELPYGFKTAVGSAQTKQANEWLNGYLTLLQYNSRQVAEEFISQMPDTYDEHLKLLARLLLESVPTNGILIVEGDNDTYPLLYLQLKENVRSDVLVINRHLLSNPRYVNMLRRGKQVGGELKLSTDDEIVRSWQARKYMPGDRYELYNARQVLRVLSNLSVYAAPNVINTLPFGGMQLSSRVDGPLFARKAVRCGWEIW